MFRLAHISDPHMGPLPRVNLTDLANKRILGFVNWRRNRQHIQDAGLLAALVEDIRAHQPNHIAVTGDLVNLGLTLEFEAATAWLGALGAPEDVTVVPGNHDAYVPGALDELIEHWHPYMSGDGAAGEVAFPFIRRRGKVAIVGVSSAIPTAPLMATGEIGGGQAAALASRLAALGRAGFFRIVLIHHAPETPPIHWTRRLIDGDLFRRAVAESGAELVLHGHNHHTSVTYLDGRDGDVPVVGAAAASMRPRLGRHGGSYLLYDIDETARDFTLTITERGVKTGLAVETFAVHRLTGTRAQPLALQA